jgi:hypothetical protein
MFKVLPDFSEEFIGIEWVSKVPVSVFLTVLVKRDGKNSGDNYWNMLRFLLTL